MVPRMPPERDKFFAIFGGTLFVVQAAERVLAETLIMVVPNKMPAAMEDLLSTSAKIRKQTLDQLISALNKTINVDPKLERTLARFLECRNIFVHRLDEVRKPQMYSDEWIAKTSIFVRELHELAHFVLDVLADKTVQWADHAGVEGSRIGALRQIIRDNNKGISAQLLPSD